MSRRQRLLGNRAGLALAALVLLASGCSSASSGNRVAAAATTTSAAPAASVTPTLSTSAAWPSSATAAASVALPTGVLASIPLTSGDAPAVVGIAYGSVWVGSHRSNNLYRIDPKTDKVLATIDLGQTSCSQLIGADHLVWVAYCDDSTNEVGVSPLTNQVVASLPSAYVFGVAAGSLWAANADGSSLDRLDPKTYRLISTVPAAGEVGAIGGGYVWVVDENGDGAYDGTISKVDPATGKVVATLRTASTSDYVYCVYADGLLWLRGANDGFLVRVDTATGKAAKVTITAQPIDLSDFSDDPVVAGLGSIWVRTTSKTVLRMDPMTGKGTGRYPGDPGANGGWPALGFGSLWEANFDSDTVWRVRVAT